MSFGKAVHDHMSKLDKEGESYSVRLNGVDHSVVKHDSQVLELVAEQDSSVTVFISLVHMSGLEIIHNG